MLGLLLRLLLSWLTSSRTEHTVSLCTTGDIEVIQFCPECGKELLGLLAVCSLYHGTCFPHLVFVEIGSGCMAE